MSTGKRKRVSLGEKYKVITDLESGLKPSKVAEKYDVPRTIKNCVIIIFKPIFEKFAFTEFLIMAN